MDKFKKSLVRKVRFAALYLLVLAALVSVLTFVKGIDPSMLNFFQGVMVGFALVLLAYVGSCSAALKNEDKLRKLYIKETDERTILIMRKSHSAALTISVLTLLLGTFVACFYNRVVTWTLFCVLCLVLLVTGLAKLYFTKTL